MEAAISGLKLSAAANTFSQNSTVTILEQSPTGTGSDGYSASSRSYVINAYKDTDKGKSYIKEVEQPVLLTIQAPYVYSIKLVLKRHSPTLIDSNLNRLMTKTVPMQPL